MFNWNKSELTNIFNPLKVGKESTIEFTVGELAKKDAYRIKKIIEFYVENKKYARYLLFSQSEENEYVLEAFPSNTGRVETFLYRLTDTIEFSEEFLDVVGRTYITTPDGIEYQRVMRPNCEERMDGVWCKIRIFDIDSDQIQKEVAVQVWEYSREENGRTEYLNVEMMDDTGVFRIFAGEMIEDIFYKIYSTQ